MWNFNVLTPSTLKVHLTGDVFCEKKNLRYIQLRKGGHSNSLFLCSERTQQHRQKESNCSQLMDTKVS